MEELERSIREAREQRDQYFQEFLLADCHGQALMERFLKYGSAAHAQIEKCTVT